MSIVKAVARGAIELASLGAFVATILIISVLIRALVTGEGV